MREYRRQPDMIRAEIEAGLLEYEEIRADLFSERTERDRIARCGTIVVPDAEWFYRSLLYAVHGRLPDMAHVIPTVRHPVMLH